MRLMLGKNDQPEWLVDVSDNRDPHNFKFWVVNGGWEGTYNKGTVTVHGAPRGDFDITGVYIVCHEQDRLRGDYKTVFENYDNVNYCAPKFEIPNYWEDDITF